MNIIVASKNPVKIEAVLEVISNYDLLKDFEVLGKQVNSNVSKQPIGQDETVQGAINRAKLAYNKNCYLSFGIESGLTKVKYSKTGYLNFTVCAIYDGVDIALGFSSAFECPIKIIEKVENENLDVSQACREVELTNSSDIGREQGLIGILTKGRVTRKDYTKDAIRFALIQIENRDLYFYDKK